MPDDNQSVSQSVITIDDDSHSDCKRLYPIPNDENQFKLRGIFNFGPCECERLELAENKDGIISEVIPENKYQTIPKLRRTLYRSAYNVMARYHSIDFHIRGITRKNT